MEALVRIQILLVGYVRAQFAWRERGASIVEYALLVGLIAIVCLLAVAFLGTSTSTRFSTIGSQVTHT